MNAADLGDSLARSVDAIGKAVEKARRQVIRDLGATARAEHLKFADEVPGSDRKFSGTDRFNGGRLGVRTKYEYDSNEVRISPRGPWGLPAGKGRRGTPAFRSWDKGERSTTDAADRRIPAAIDKSVQEAFDRG